MTKKITSIILLHAMVVYFINGCSASIEKTENKAPKQVTIEVSEPNLLESKIYGVHTNDIQVLLDATPIGSEISLEEGDDGEWHLKIEKIFTVENMNHQEVEYIDEPLREEKANDIAFYSSETILI